MGLFSSERKEVISPVQDFMGKYLYYLDGKGANLFVARIKLSLLKISWQYKLNLQGRLLDS